MKMNCWEEKPSALGIVMLTLAVSLALSTFGVTRHDLRDLLVTPAGARRWFEGVLALFFAGIRPAAGQTYWRP
ncbi:hypothetical protein [Aurantimonas endophytica]|uniref:Uncharacterized protein n=1 Tax=Aurantimonas endophytica TaxID=1522175 RepID=A0A7W6H9N5_9HYPH|nr:hypothetical protein [Aurantimonas endophytica]MBB4001199.1 hypothetical protein [Aurantimonas endophytica]MCO6403149.1 hypothetical protein [Aurantimonas endophytica]